MDLLEAALLGLVQGLTEFLPVSSSGHLVIAETLLGGFSDGILFEIAVHAGTLLAILFFYRELLLGLTRGVLGRDPESLHYVGKLALATLPAVGVGLGLKEVVEGLFARPMTVGFALWFTGALLWSTRHTRPLADAPQPTWSQAFWIGCAQAVAIVPGVSRSGATVSVGLALGVAPLAATEFSFLMAIAAISGAMVLALPDVAGASPELLMACGLGALVAAVSGLAALWLFVRTLDRFHHFALYVWGAGAAFLAYLWLGA
jgi:undecaprenyl-diphosphatase